MADGPRYLAVKATGGMGNRLLGIVCAVAYCLMTGRTLHVDWSDFMYSDAGENVFPRLFKIQGLPFCHRLPRTEDVYPEFWRPFLHTDALIEQFGIDHHDPAVMELTRIDLRRRYEHAVTALWSYDLAPLRAALPQIREQLPRFGGLDADAVCGEIMKTHVLPRPIVARRVEDFASRRFHGPMIGVHIRHTDLCMPFDETVAAVKKIQKAMPAKVFLATDSQPVERAMAALFGDDLVAMPKGYPQNGGHLHCHRVEGQSNFEKALDAAVEMYLLARCDAIVRYARSSFAQISGYCSNLAPERLVSVN
jgi:hypothetical protein